MHTSYTESKPRVAFVLTVMMLLSASAAARTGNYLIVTAPNYDNSVPLNQLIAAKTAQGLTVSVYVVPDGTPRETIKAYIQSLWETPSAPRYLLLVGDTDGSSSTAATIPHFTGGGSKSAPTDLPYACMGPGTDWDPEFAVGRFSVRTVDQLQAVVDKTLTVESGVYPDPSYAKRAALLATSDTGAQSEALHDYCIANYLEPADFECTRIYANQGGDTADVTEALNLGSLFLVYFGHSGSSGWWTPSFGQGDINALSNAGLYGLVFGFSCNTANYPYAECFGETWLRAPNKGAAAYISASTFIYYGGDQWESSRRVEKCFFRSVCEYQNWEVGPAWQAGMRDFCADPEFSDDVKRNMSEMFIVLGDPSLMLPHAAASPIPGARVRQPNGGEVCVFGSPFTILWTAHDDVDVTSVDLLLSTDGGTTFPHTLASGLANTGTYTTIVPGQMSTHCRVKVLAHDADGNTGEDVSDADFAIAQFGAHALYQYALDTDPGWSTEGLWAFGQPTGGGSHAFDPTSGYTGANVYGYNLGGDYPDNMSSTLYLTTTPLDLSAASGVALKFWRWLGVESASYDHAMIQVSNDNANWNTVWNHAQSVAISESDWSQSSYDLGTVADHQATVYVRWGMGPTDSSVTYPGWNIDDVEIWGVLDTPPVCAGDADCDGHVGFGDIDYFVASIPDNLAAWATLYAAQHGGDNPPCSFANCDADGDGHVGFMDIDPFVTLIPATCP